MKSETSVVVTKSEEFECVFCYTILSITCNHKMNIDAYGFPQMIVHV